ncbi:metallopeptidase family protein [Curtobacterium ammoniigenes]|uniref:metallopeptidase family protein n=1 Tax=Curtobacterium ammoniigenes TaxID=395387 RepID=UPI000829BA95|nr:metallopeptidase family protein [Curtobacterium ammoniigenes]
MIEISLDAFEELVGEELDHLPADVIARLENVAFLVADAPDSVDSADSIDADAALDVFGEYVGVAATERGQYGFGELPDQIIVYRRAHAAACSTMDELRSEIRTTLAHEIGHFHGIDDVRLHELGWG